MPQPPEAEETWGSPKASSECPYLHLDLAPEGAFWPPE